MLWVVYLFTFFLSFIFGIGCGLVVSELIDQNRKGDRK